LRASLLVQAASFLPVVLFPAIPSFFVTRILGSIALSLNAPSYYNYLVSRAPLGRGGTTVSLFDVTLRSGVSLLAAPLAGSLFDLFGPYWLYVIGLGGCLLAWLILLAGAALRPGEAPE
jgi:MFS family permease